MNSGITVTNTRSKIYILAITAVMSAVMCVLAPIAIPVGPVPVTLATLVLLLSVYILGWKFCTVSIIIYLLLGMAGLPVFSGFSGGLAKLVGPTGGYLIGYIPMAVIAGLFIEKTRNRLMHIVGMVLGTAVLYVFGTAWFCVLTSSALGTALTLCVIPFLPGDIAKIVVALLFGSVLRKSLTKALN